MHRQIRAIFEESIKVKQQSLANNEQVIIEVVECFTRCLQSGGKLLFFGNGGSAADSQHIAAEFIGRFQRERRALPALALTTDSSILTALGNDYSFDIVFARQIEGLGNKGDVAFGISTSGNSKNVVEGIRKAKEKGLHTVTLTGNDGGQLAKLSEYSLIVPSKITARIQECHLCIAHIICDLVEQAFAK